MNITFLLPGNGSGGGTRVTMEMANCLFQRGHAVRIAYRTPVTWSVEGLVSIARSTAYRCQGLFQTKWLDHFQGEKIPFKKLSEVDFKDREIVIATGPHTIPELRALERNVLKVGYCHGLMESEVEIWKNAMDAIAVSPVHVRMLEQDCGVRVLGVVPNGIRPEDYFVEQGKRDGIGFIFSQHPVKGSEVAVALVQAFTKRFPGVPCHVFGGDRRWKTLSPCNYTRYPSIAKARSIYNKCKVWLITSRVEGFCLPILEAMACGCAIVSSRHTNAGELIQDGVNGFTVPYGDVNAYLDRIERLLSDEFVRNGFVQEGFKTVQKFTWPKATDQMEQALAKLQP